MSENKTQLGHLTDSGADALAEMAKEPEKFEEFLRYHGRIFKHNTHVALEFYAQHPDAQFIASRNQWTSLGYTVRQGADTICFMMPDGRETDLCDFSQIEEAKQPPVWAINKKNAPEIKKQLGIDEKSSIMMGALRQVLATDSITECMKMLNYPVNEYEHFRNAYISTVQTIMAGRMSMGGSSFNVHPDHALFQALKTDEQRMTFLTHTAHVARKALLQIENIINGLQAMERNERYERENDLRTVDSPDNRGAEQRTGREAAGDSAGTAYEQTDESSLQESGRSDRLGNDTDTSEQVEHGVVSGVQAEKDPEPNVLVQVQSDLRSVQHESDGLRTERGGRTDRVLRQTVDGLHGGESSGAGGVDAVETPVSDRGKIGEQIGMGLQASSGRAVRPAEPPTAGLRGSAAMGTGEDVLHGRDGNEGESLGADHNTVTDKADTSTLAADRITSFRNEHYFLSNMFPTPVEYENATYTCAESAFQAAKCENPADRHQFEGIDGFTAKKIGRHVPLRKDWENIKDSVMLDVLRAKFSDPEMREKLLATGDAELVEMNTWGDRYWGVDSRSGIGQNKLGNSLMKVRNEQTKVLSQSKDSDTFIEKLNSFFSEETEEASTEESSADASIVSDTVVSEADAYLAEHQTDTPVIILPGTDVSVDLSEVDSIEYSSVREEIIEHDQSEIVRENVSFSYDADLSVILMRTSPLSDGIYVTPDEASAELAKLMQPESNTEKSLTVGMYDGENVIFTSVEDYAKALTAESDDLEMEAKPLTTEQEAKQITEEIIEMQQQLIELSREGRFHDVQNLAAELIQKEERKTLLEKQLQDEGLTAEDAKRIKNVTPRISFQNMPNGELVEVTKFKPMLQETLGSKSPFELRKDGGNDWRKDEKQLIPVVHVEESKLTPKKARNAFNKSEQLIVNRDTGLQVEFIKSSLDEMIDKALKRGRNSVKDEYFNVAVATSGHIRELVENAVCFDSEISEYDPVTSKNKSPYTLFMHKMYGVVEYKGDYYLSCVEVEQRRKPNTADNTDTFGNTGNRTYNVKQIKVIAPIRNRGLLTPASVPLGTKDVPMGAIYISIPQLYALVKRFDRNFYENPNAIGREAREAELYAQALSDDASNVMENSIGSERNERNQIVRFAQSHSVSVFDAANMLNTLVDTYQRFPADGRTQSDVENAKDESFSRAVDAAYQPIIEQFVKTDRQRKFINDLKTFTITNHVHGDPVDAAFSMSRRFRGLYVDIAHVSSDLFQRRFKRVHDALVAEMEKQMQLLKEEKSTSKSQATEQMQDKPEYAPDVLMKGINTAPVFEVGGIGTLDMASTPRIVFLETQEHDGELHFTETSYTYLLENNTFQKQQTTDNIHEYDSDATVPLDVGSSEIADKLTHYTDTNLTVSLVYENQVSESLHQYLKRWSETAHGVVSVQANANIAGFDQNNSRKKERITLSIEEFNKRWAAVADNQELKGQSVYVKLIIGRIPQGNDSAQTKAVEYGKLMTIGEPYHSLEEALQQELQQQPDNINLLKALKTVRLVKTEANETDQKQDIAEENDPKNDTPDQTPTNNGSSTPSVPSSGSTPPPAPTADSDSVTPDQGSESAIHRAFADIYENYSLSNQAKQYLERAEKQIEINHYPDFDVKMLGLPMFVQTYGHAHRVNENLFDGQLKEIIARINENIHANGERAAYSLDSGNKALTPAQEQKIQRNNDENEKFSQSIQAYLHGDYGTQTVFRVGTTPYSLRIVGAKAIPVVISQSVLKNSLSTGKVSKEHTEGHNIPPEVLEHLPESLRNPILVCRGHHPDTLAVICDSKDNQGNNVLVALALDVQGAHSKVNKITTIFGKKNIANFLQKEIDNNDILAMHTQKTEELFSHIGIQSPKSATILCFNDSIAYSDENVKRFSEISSQNDTEKFDTPGYHYYVIADMSTWARNMQQRSPLQRYDTLEEALASFRELRQEPYNSEVVLNQDNQPMARLTLGIQRTDGQAEFDLIHVRSGQNYLNTDYMRNPATKEDPVMHRIIDHVEEQIGIERVLDFKSDENGNTVSVDLDYKDWHDSRTDNQNPADQERATYSTNEPAENTELGEQMVLLDEPKIYRVVTYSHDSGDDDKMDYATIEEAAEAGRQYITDDDADGFAILNLEEHKIELYEGDFPQTGIFSERVYKNSEEWNLAIPHWNGSPIHYGFFGNGITAYDTSRRDPETNDYPTVAHISDEGKVKIYDDKHLTDYDRHVIEEESAKLRSKFERDWYSRSITGRFEEIMDRANAGQMLQIGREELSMEEAVAKYEKSVIFGDEPFPNYQPDNTDAAEHSEADVQKFAEAFGLDREQLDSLIAAQPTEDTVNRYGSLNVLMRTVEVEKAAKIVDPDEELQPSMLNRRISNAVRDFIVYGTLPDALRTEQRATYSTNPEQNPGSNEESDNNTHDETNAAEKNTAFTMSSITEAEFEKIKPLMDGSISYQAEARDGMMWFAVSPNQAAAFSKAIQDATQQSNFNGNKISEMTFAEQVDATIEGKLSFYTQLKVCDTPPILESVGCDALPMLYTQNHLRKAIEPKDKKEHKHGITIEQVKSLPMLLENPVFIADSISRKDSIVVVTSESDPDGNPILVSVKPNGKGRYEVEEIDSNFITSVYGRNNFPEFLKRLVDGDCVLYADKQKSQALLERWGEQYSELTSSLDFNTIIHQSRNIVKSESQKNSEETVNSDSNSQERATYSTSDQAVPTPAVKRGRPTRAEQLYKQFTEQFPNIASGEHTYERYGSYEDESGYEPLSVEHLGGNVYGFMTSYIQNGDLMRDPDFTFRVDQESERIEMLEYQQDGVYPIGTLYQAVEDENGKPDLRLRAALEENFMQNLRNAEYAGRKLTVYTDKNGDRTEVEKDDTASKTEQTQAEEPDNSVVPDATPELRNTLNEFSKKHGLGMLQIEQDRMSWKLCEIMQDGYKHSFGTLYGSDYSIPYTPETLQKALDNLESTVEKRGDDVSDLYSRKRIVMNHGGISPLPKVRDDLPEIWYADSPSQRISNNISAINELLRLEKAEQDGVNPYDKRSNQYNSRQASEARLRQYCGWGGLPQIFDERYSAYQYSRKRLQELLTPEEYAAARASTLNAHYTSQAIIDAMYKAVKNMGLPRDSRILEPSCGTGNFISRMPSGIGQGGVVGVELDSITARIAHQLNKDNPNVRIIESGFERTHFENNSFDLAIGNVPFGDYNLNDPDYVQDWRIHDAFFRKALDKVAPGGVVAFITSTGTLDKANPKIREYLAERADLIGAIRLPNNAFADAGTKASSDMIFLQKRSEPLKPYDPKPDWCYTAPNKDGLMINSYFVNNPQMVLGKMEKTSHFDMLTCTPFPDADLQKQLDDAVKQLNARITVAKREKAARERAGSIEPWGKSFTYQVKDGKVYYRKGEKMEEIKCSKDKVKQYEALCQMRNICRELLDRQKTAETDNELITLRQELNRAYDSYRETYGELSTKAVSKMFGADADYPIICSLENVNSETERAEKADIFFKRTVNPTIEITSVQSIEEALQVSLDKRGKPDIPYMAALLSQEPQEVCTALLEKGEIFIDPERNLPDKPFSGVVERAEYLSGNVRRKLTMAADMVQVNPEYQRNVDALKTVIPEDIKAEEIFVRMGCAWIDTEDYTKFLTHLSGRPEHAQRCMVTYSTITGEFDIINAGSKKDLNQNEGATYGTADFTMYELADKILNQRRIVVQKEYPNPNDPSTTITRTDPKATKIAIDKANQIKAEFQKWIFADDKRKTKYERRYNDIFNSLVGREYNGSKLTFSGIRNDFILRPHQKNCVARAIYGGNTLAAHVVGAGKSAVMFTTIMKKKELGLINKACVVVPKPLTEQVAKEWRSLYPDAKLLTVTNDDLSTEAKRNIFTARVATGAYDAVIMSQEQFEKIPMSLDYRARFMCKELDQVDDMLREKKAETGGKRDPSIKMIERIKKMLESRIGKMLDPKAAAKAKDNLLEFEQLGFDFLCVDEAHFYKNGFVNTKMSNVAGVTTRPSGRAEDMQMKTDYFNEQMGQGHILMCTGTPVSNSMTELYVMTRYLRPDLLKAAGVERFDDWAATFGNVVTKNQQGADGQLKLRTCFSTFANLPELMAMYKEFADVQSADKLHLPRPELKYGKPQIIEADATPEQTAYVQQLAERAKAISNGSVKPEQDNLLKITGEARLIGLGNQAIRALYQKNGQELPPDFTDSKDSKVDLCVNKVAEIFHSTTETRGVQLIFSDIAVNSDNGNFSVYDYIKKELIAKGIPEEEIIFAPKSDAKNREDIFRDINESKYRVVIASTGTLGTGANIQNNLVALHHVDIPWKPSDFEQREGRILRQGNQNKEVEIFNYVTKGTLDSYLYQTVTDKARFIAQLLDDNCPARVSEDCDEKVLTFGEIQAAAEGNPAFKRRIELQNSIAELSMLQKEFQRETGMARSKAEILPDVIAKRQQQLTATKIDAEAARRISDIAIRTADGRFLTENKVMNDYLHSLIQERIQFPEREIQPFSIGKFTVKIDVLDSEPRFTIKGEQTYFCAAGTGKTQNNVQRLSNFFEKGILKTETDLQKEIEAQTMNLEQAEQRMTMKFDREDELNSMISELAELEESLSALSIQEDVLIDPEEETDPIIETADEKAKREAEYSQGDADDVKPYERHANDDQLDPPTMRT